MKEETLIIEMSDEIYSIVQAIFSSYGQDYTKTIDITLPTSFSIKVGEIKSLLTHAITISRAVNYLNSLISDISSAEVIDPQVNQELQKLITFYVNAFTRLKDFVNS